MYIVFVKLLSKLLGSEMGRGTGGGGQLQGEDLHDFCSSSDVIWAVKSRRMRWVGSVARRGENTGATVRVVVKLQTLGILIQFAFIDMMCCTSHNSVYQWTLCLNLTVMVTETAVTR